MRRTFPLWKIESALSLTSIFRGPTLIGRDNVRVEVNNHMDLLLKSQRADAAGVVENSPVVWNTSTHQMPS